MKTKMKIMLLMLMANVPILSAFKWHDENRNAKVKVIAVVNKANWCSVCMANGPRAVATFKENNQEGKFLFIFNDLTNEETKRESMNELRKVGLENGMKNYKATGVCYFFNAETKESITQVTVANSDKELAYVMNETLKAVK